MALDYKPIRDTPWMDIQAAIRYSCARTHDSFLPPYSIVQETLERVLPPEKGIGPIQWEVPVIELCPQCAGWTDPVLMHSSDAALRSRGHLTLGYLIKNNENRREFRHDGRLLHVVPKGSLIV